MFGAFGAHGLRKMAIEATKVKAWETAAHYQLVHAVPVLLAALNADSTSGWLIVAGTTLFSGSIYCLILRPQWRILGPVTPIGGLLMIAGWISVAYNHQH